MLSRILLFLALLIGPAVADEQSFDIAAGAFGIFMTAAPAGNSNGALVQTSAGFANFSGDYIPLDRAKDGAEMHPCSGGGLDPSHMNQFGWPTSNAVVVAGSGWCGGTGIETSSEKAGPWCMDWTHLGTDAWSFATGGTVLSANGGMGCPTSTGCSASGNTVTGSNCVVTVDYGAGGNVAWSITGISGTGGAQTFRLYAASDAANVASGYVCKGTKFASQIGSNFRVLRDLNKSVMNDAGIVSWSDRKPAGYYSYFGSYFPLAIVEPTNLVTVSSGVSYTLARSGFALTQGAKVIANLAAAITVPSAATNASTASGGTTLRFATAGFPASVVTGMAIAHGSNGNAIQQARITNISSAGGNTTITVACPTGHGTGCTSPIYGNISNGDTIYFSPMLSVNGTTSVPMVNGEGYGFGTPFTATTIFQQWSTFIYNAAMNAFLVSNQNNYSSGIWAGYPPEVMLQCANELGMDPWFVMPPYAADPPSDWMTNLTAYVAANILPGLKPWFEAGPNELWNNQFYATHLAFNLESIRTGNEFDADNWYGRVAAQSCKTVNAQFGTSGAECAVAFQLISPPTKGGGGSDNRMASAEFVGNGGWPAYQYATQAVTAYYIISQYYQSTWEAAWSYWWANGATSPQDVTMFTSWIAGFQSGAFGNPYGATLFDVVNYYAPIYLTYQTAYAGTATFGLNMYEGGPEPGPGGFSGSSDFQNPIISVTTGNPTVLTVEPSFTGYITNGNQIAPYLPFNTAYSQMTITSGSPPPLNIQHGLACSGCSPNTIVFLEDNSSSYRIFPNQIVGSSGSPIAITGNNGWNFIVNTAGITNSTTQIQNVCAALNGNTYTVTAATATTITINANTTGGCSYGGSGGTASYVGSGSNLSAFEAAVMQDTTPTNYQAIVTSYLQQFWALGFTRPSVYDTTDDAWGCSFRNVYAVASPCIAGVKAFNQAPWLMWRDMDPASNDNTPAWLNKAA